MILGVEFIVVIVTPTIFATLVLRKVRRLIRNSPSPRGRRRDRQTSAGSGPG